MKLVYTRDQKEISTRYHHNTLELFYTKKEEHEINKLTFIGISCDRLCLVCTDQEIIISVLLQ